MDNIPLKARLIDLLQHVRADEQALIAELSDADRAAAGTLEHWSAKDLVAHITAWRRRLAERLEAALRGETPQFIDTADLDEVNAATFEENSGRSWADVLAESERVFDRVVALLSQFTEGDLTDPNRYPWRKGDPLWWNVLGNSFFHPETHMIEHYRERNDIAGLERLSEGIAAAVQSKLGDSPRMRGLGLYNVACVYATTGKPEKALPLLREALPLHPRLFEWSKQDPDLDSLRDHPEYQALYAGS
jgi:hypothetical protein